MLTRCRLCGSGDLRPLYDLPAATVTVARCGACGFESIREVGTEEELRELYTKLYDEDLILEHHVDRKSGLFEDRLRELAELRPLTGARVLDVGCGGGEFLLGARERGARPYGSELSRSAITFAREQQGLEVRGEPLESPAWEASSMDVVSLWDVVEHVRTPRELLERAHEILAPGGLLGLTTPVRDCAMHRVAVLAYRLSGGRSSLLLCHRFNRLHLHIFASDELRRLLGEVGFEVLRLDKILQLSFPPVWYFERSVPDRRLAAALGRVASAALALAPLRNKVLIWARKP